MLDSGGNVKWYSTMQNSSAVPKKLAPRYIPQSIDNRDWSKYLCTTAHSIIHNSQKLETTLCLTDKSINKCDMYIK